MLKLLDHLVLRSYFKAYAVCFFSLVSLYIVIDLFSNLDEFMEATGGTGMVRMFETMAVFYFYRLVLIFERLCGTIAFLSGTFTIAWMQRHNELLPMLSAGISTRRILRPIFLGTLAVVGISLANRELLMPGIADQLQNPAEDPRGEKSRPVSGAYEPNGILITGKAAFRRDMTVHGFTCTIPERLAGGLYHIAAKEGRYIPKGPEEYSGGWMLTETTPAELKWDEAILKTLGPGRFFLRTERVDFDLVTRSRNWYQFAPTLQLFDEMQKGESARLAATAVQFHTRLTLPLLVLIMVWMGLSVILRDQSRNVFLSAGLCLVLAAGFYAVGYGCKHLGEYEYLSPPLAAWLPVLIFGPLALAMFDAIHT